MFYQELISPMKKFLFLICLCIPILSFSQTWDDLNNEAFGYYQKGKYKSALEIYDKALTQAKTEFGDQSKEYATTLHNIGKVYSEGGAYEKSEKYYLLSLDIKKKIFGPEHENYALTLNNLGTVKIYMGNYTEAEKYLLESAAIRKKVFGVLHLDYASSLNNLAYLYQMMNRLDDAEANYLESLSIKGQIEGLRSEGYAQGLNNLGYLYQEMGRYSEAEKFYLNALDIKRELFGPKHPHYAETLSNLGVLYSELGQFKNAINNLVEAKEIFLKILGNTDPTYALIINNLAYAHKSIQEYTEAEAYYKESIEINRSTIGIKSPYYAMGLSNLGILYSDTKRYSESIPLYKEALTILEASVGKKNPRYGEALANLATAYHKSGFLLEADTNYRLALTLREASFDSTHTSIASVKYNMAMLYWDMKDVKKAKGFFIDAIEIFNYQVKNQSHFLSESEMSLFLNDNSYYGKTFYSFCNEFYTQDPSLIGEMHSYYSIVNGILLKNANQLKLDIAASNDTSLVDKYSQWQALKISINKEMALPGKYRNKFLSDWEKQSTDIEKDLLRSSSNFRSELESSEVNWKNIQSQLKPTEALIEFISFPLIRGVKETDSVLYAAMITRPQDSFPLYVPLFEEGHLEGLLSGDTLRTFANLLYTEAQIRTIEHDISYGDSLYKLIWQPMEPYLANVSHIYYSPSADLHRVSFEAIPMKDSKLLSDKYQLDRVSNGDNIKVEAVNNFQISSISLFGGIQYDLDTVALKANDKNKSKKIDDIIYASRGASDDTLSRGGSWSYLPGAKKEVESIANILKGSKIKYSIYTDNNGNEEKVKNLDSKNSPTVLHFSTHGFFFPPPSFKEISDTNANPFATSKNPLFRSGLIFAGANYVWKGYEPIEGMEDGILTAYEVSNLYMPNTQLVVMSACETGLGDIKRSEGIYGLQRALKMAGVDYIIVTLWEVLDKETSDFMILFYQNLIEKKSIPIAFKTTQDAMKNKYRDEPYKWAGFVLIN